MPRPNTSGYVGVKKRGDRWAAYEKDHWFGLHDTAHEAAVARAEALGLPPPMPIAAAAPVQPARAANGELAAAVRRWYEGLWMSVQPWQMSNFVAQAEMRHWFCRHTGTEPDSLSVRHFATMVRKCVDLTAVPHRLDGKVCSCWFITAESACPPHLLPAWKALQQEDVQQRAAAQEQQRQERERRLAEEEERETAEYEEEERRRTIVDNERVKKWLRRKGIAETDENINRYRYAECEPNNSDGSEDEEEYDDEYD